MDREAGEAVRAFLDAFHRRDMRALVDLAHAEILIQPLSTQVAERRNYRGREGIRRYLSDVDGTWRELKITVTAFHEAGGCVVADARIYARSHPPSSYIADSPAGLAWLVRDGLVAWGRTYPSFEAALAGVRSGDAAEALEAPSAG